MSAVLSYRAHAGAILALGLPLIGGHMAQFAIGLTDSVMLGWYGVEALAAATLGHSYFFVLFLMGSGFAWAVMPLVAAYAAKGDEIGLRRATRMALWLSTGFALAVLPLLIWSEPVLRALGQSAEMSELAARYLRLVGWSLFPALLVMVLKSYLAALERTQIVLWITLLAAVVNAGLNWLFIFGNLGAPEMGVEGAALASIGTQVVSLAGVALYAALALPEHQLFRRLWRPDGDMLALVFRMGVPIGLTSLSEVSLFAASAMMMGWLGTVPLAAHGIAIQLATAAFMVHLGLSNVATIRAGNAFGRADADHAARGAKASLALSLAVALVTVAAFLLLPEPLISIFVEPDDPARPAIVATGTVLLALAAVFQLMDGAQVLALGLLRGLQDTAVPMVIAAASYWVVGMPASYLLGFSLGWGGTGVWLGLVLGLACAGLLLMLRFWKVALPRLDAMSRREAQAVLSEAEPAAVAGITPPHAPS